MFIESDTLAYDLVALVVTIITSVVFYYKWSYTYWEKRGLEFLKPSIPFGNTRDLFLSKKSFGDQFALFYAEFRKRGLKHGGVYSLRRPFYIPTDPAIIKDILQKNFNSFVDRGFYVNEIDDPLSGHLFNLRGAKWKNLRAKLTATFTSGKMKMMFETMAQCAVGLNSVMDRHLKLKTPLDCKEILTRFSTDVISSCAFGLESNCLEHFETQTPFRYYGERIFKNTTWEMFKVNLQFILPHAFLKLIHFRVNKSDVEDFMMNIVKKTVDFRERNNIYRKDFLHLVIQLKNRGKISDDDIIIDEKDKGKPKENGLTIDELAAQVFVFFAAGYETSSTAMTFAIYELAQNLEMQKKLHQEINTVLEKYNNEISYEAIMEMTYLDKVVNESLRKYPPLSFLNRICNKTYQVPDSKIVLEEGTPLVVSVSGLHHDPEYYPEPSKYDPERFSDENKKTRPPFTFMPFGEGPRNCIGMRFGLLQSKLGLATLFKNYRITLNKKTHEPLEIDPKILTTAIKEKIWLDVERVN